MKKRILRHVLFWVVYYLWVVCVSASYDYKFSRAFLSEAVTLPLKIMIAYTILYYLLPQYLVKKKYSQLLLISALLILCSGFIYRVLQGAIILPMYFPKLAFTPWDAGRFMWALFDIYSVSAVSLSIKLFRLKYDSTQREKELEKEKLKTELNFLKAQINPHFLFNTLNNIYGLSLKNSPKTSDSILKLSELLRYMIHDGSLPSIKIADEIRIINDYIELERLRYNNRLNLQLNQEIDNPNERIAPLLLLPFVENSFKHGVSETRFESTIDISIKLINGYLEFTVINSKEDENHNDSGIGLKNILRQLELIYGDHHQIRIRNSQNIFEIHLTINLKRHAVEMHHS